ncbi:MAG: hypothetical protein ISS15_07535 [Alphaproteobacteria bacterium]|nr:hypothetical protein [Alphaproteobacteria bacterium]MBL7097492.1 hypothetical protein [Alphaproteobacteria bacterium]
MSLEVYVFIKEVNIPTAESWQASIDRAGFPMTFAPGFEPLKDKGFVPCTFDGVAAGFEYVLSEIDEVASSYPNLQEKVRGYDSVVTFRWGSRLRECAVALLAASSLTDSVSGFMYEPQEGLEIQSSQALEYASRTLMDLRAMMKRFPKR